MMTSKPVSTDPDVFAWCDEARIESLINQIGPALPLLVDSNLLRSAITFWIKKQVLLEFLTEKDHTEAMSDRNKANQALLRWARSAWGHRLENLYLAEKHHLDRVSCSLLRVKDQYLAFELYHRLKAEESSFDELSWKFGQGQERRQGGRFNNQRIQSIPEALHPILRTMKEGSVSKPHKFSEWYGIIFLDNFSPAQFDEDTKNLLLKAELNKWLAKVVGVLESHL